MPERNLDEEWQCDVCYYVFAFGVLPGGSFEFVWSMELCDRHAEMKREKRTP